MYAFLADVVLVVHLLIVAGAVLPVPLMIIGKFRGWQWIHHFWLRMAHMGLLVFVTIQAVLGQHCPLTYLEQYLLTQAGERSYEGSFISRLVSGVIYYELPSEVFLTIYALFTALVLTLLFWIPLRRSS